MAPGGQGDREGLEIQEVPWVLEVLLFPEDPESLEVRGDRAAPDLPGLLSPQDHLTGQFVVAGESVVVEGPESSEKSLSAAESLGAEPKGKEFH